MHAEMNTSVIGIIDFMSDPTRAIRLPSRKLATNFSMLPRGLVRAACIQSVMPRALQCNAHEICPPSFRISSVVNCPQLHFSSVSGTDDLLKRQKKLLYRCKQRGLIELDLLLGKTIFGAVYFVVMFPM
jgi:hypothetical protein